MENESLLKKYQGYLSTILSGIDFVEDEEGDYDIKTVTRIAKVSIQTVKRCNAFLDSDEINDHEKKYWEALKFTSFSLISDLSGVITSIFANAKIDGTMWQLLYFYEVCTEIVLLLNNEKIKDSGGETIQTGSLTPEEIERIRSMVK